MVSFLSLAFGRAERDESKKRPLSISLGRARRKAQYENTERGPRASRAFSLARAAHTNFPTIRPRRRLAESSWLVLGVSWWRGSPGARGGVSRERGVGYQTRPAEASAFCGRSTQPTELPPPRAVGGFGKARLRRLRRGVDCVDARPDRGGWLPRSSADWSIL